MVDHEHDDRADDGDDHAVEIESSNPTGTHCGKYEASDDCADNTKNDVEDHTLTSLIDDPARDESRDEAEDQPRYYRHEVSPGCIDFRLLFGRRATVLLPSGARSRHTERRTLQALGHTVRLVPAAYVRPFVKPNKTDARDAEAICEAMQRPSMRFVAVKSIDQQAARGIETTRDMLVRQCTQIMNCLRGQLAEFGIVAAQGRRGFAELCRIIEAQSDVEIPAELLRALRHLLQQWGAAQAAIDDLEMQIAARANADPVMRRLMGVPGIGPLTAHALVSAIGGGQQFGSARDFGLGRAHTARAPDRQQTPARTYQPPR